MPEVRTRPTTATSADDGWGSFTGRQLQVKGTGGLPIVRFPKNRLYAVLYAAWG